MGHISTVKQSVIERVLVDYTGTTTSDGNVGATTLVDSNLTVDYDGKRVIVATGSAVGESGTILGDTSGGTITVTSAFSTQILSNVRYHIITDIPASVELDSIKGSGWVTGQDLETIDTNLDAVLDDTQTSGVVVNTHTATGKGEINAEVDTALNTAIPASPTTDSVNERVAALDDHVTADYGSSEKTAIAHLQTDITSTHMGYLDAAVSTRATPAQVNTQVDGALDTAIPGSPTANSINERIKTLDDNYTDTRAGYLDNVNNSSLANVVVDGTSYVEARIKATDDIDLSTTQKASVNTEVDTALNTAVPTSPIANSINERIKTLDDNYTATRAGYLDQLDFDLDARLGTPATDVSADIATVDGIVDNILLDTQIRVTQGGSKSISGSATKYLHIDSGTNGAEILSVAIEGLIGHAWTLGIYVPAADAEAATQAKSKRDSISYAAADTTGGLLSPFAMPFDCYLDFTNSGTDDTIDQVTVTYRSRGALTLTWET